MKNEEIQSNIPRDMIKTNNVGIEDCAKKIEECGEKYQEIANFFRQQLRNLKTDNLLSSTAVDQTIENIINDTQQVLDALQRNCNSYAVYLRGVIKTMSEADR